MNIYYTEIGIGNPSFINTETEELAGRETRKSGFQKGSKVQSMYMRIQISTNNDSTNQAKEGTGENEKTYGQEANT